LAADGGGSLTRCRRDQCVALPLAPHGLILGLGKQCVQRTFLIHAVQHIGSRHLYNVRHLGLQGSNLGRQVVALSSCAIMKCRAPHNALACVDCHHPSRITIRHLARVATTG
jgi:hypothetical protein